MIIIREKVQHLWEISLLCLSSLDPRKTHTLSTNAETGMYERVSLLLKPFWFVQHTLAKKVESIPVTFGRRCSALFVTVCGENLWQRHFIHFYCICWPLSCSMPIPRCGHQSPFLEWGGLAGKPSREKVPRRIRVSDQWAMSFHPRGAHCCAYESFFSSSGP